MRFRSIGFRLTLWYFVILAVALIVFGAAMWSGLRRSMYAAVDDTLRDRVQGVGKFIEIQGESMSPEEMRDEFREHSVLGPGGDIFQVANSRGNWLYRSNVLLDPAAPVYSAEILKSGRRYDNIVIRGVPLRLLSRNVQVRGEPYAVQVAANVRELNEGLDRFFWMLVYAIPLVLAAACLGGYWMSRRALVPVDEITRTAQSIGAQNLSRRLPIRETGDELQRLSSTLNSMFERLDAAFNRITRFTADASHELRTPLSFVRTTAEVALRRQRSEADYREALSEILTEVEQTASLVEDLLVLARADSGSGGLHFQTMDLAGMLRETCEQAKVLAGAKGIEFDSHLPDSGVEIEGDQQALRRVSLIFIDNAVKYTDSGGHISVDLTRKNGLAIFEVRDTGIGIAEEDLPHIFDRFYRADKARTPGAGGVGLGLSIAHWIVEAHHGEIKVQSQLGHGSSFAVILPIGTHAGEPSSQP
jgi:heavy metal sensor kinase